MMSVTLQVEAWLPRPQKRDPSKMTKKTFLQWVSVGRAKVLYHDREIVLLRAFGSESLYQPSGHASLTSFNRKHPASKNIPEPHGWWRIHPDSVKALKTARTRRRSRKKA